MSVPKRGEVWLVDFDPSMGSEIQKRRPALVISNDIANSRNTKVTVLPMTGTIRHVQIAVAVPPSPDNGLEKPSLVRVPDVSTFDKQRLVRRLGVIQQDLLEEVEAKLRLHLGL